MNDHSFIVGLSVFVMLSCVAPYAKAQDGGDGMAVEWMSSIIDGEARKLGGIKVVAEHLKSQFDVDNYVIYELREQKISYGEIGAVLAMAEQMPGGINRDNMDEIIAMRSSSHSSKNWDTIAEYMGVDRARFINRINAIAFDVPNPNGVDKENRHLTLSR